MKKGRIKTIGIKNNIKKNIQYTDSIYWITEIIGALLTIIMLLFVIYLNIGLIENEEISMINKLFLLIGMFTISCLLSVSIGKGTRAIRKIIRNKLKQ